MTKPIGRTKRTERGFTRIDFKDLYGAECSLQQSSLATEAAVWLGCNHETIHHITGEKCGARMHLNSDQVRRLIVSLTRWLASGDFRNQL